MNAWREELQGLLAETDCTRRPALRRSLREDAIYATDLPLVTTGEGLRCFWRRAEEAGWRLREESGWLQLDRPASFPPKGWYAGPFGAEAACCGSLLRRHAAGSGPRAFSGEAQAAARRLIRAAEEGPGAYEQACRRLHREWAERLRLGKPLPEMDIRFFEEEKEKEVAGC